MNPKFHSFLCICKFGDVSIVLKPAPFSKPPRREEKLSLYRNTFNLAASWVQSIRKVLWMNILNKDTCNSIVRSGFEINHIHLRISVYFVVLDVVATATGAKMMNMSEYWPEVYVKLKEIWTVFEFWMCYQYLTVLYFWAPVCCVLFPFII